MSQISDVSSLSELSDLDTHGEATYNSFKKILLNCLCIALGNLFMGYNFTNYNGLQIKHLKNIFHIHLDEATASGIVSAVYPLGCCIGSLLTQMLLYNFTRRNVLRITAIGGILSTFLTLITSFRAILFGRFMCGMCTGVFTSICPIYIKELAPLEIAGKVGVLAQVGVSVGRVVGLIVSLPYVSEVASENPPVLWWIPFAFPVLFLVLQLLLLTFVYTWETPKYHLMHHHEEEAFGIIKLIYKPKYAWDVFYRIFRDVESQRKRRARNQPANKLTITLAIMVVLSLPPPRIILTGGWFMLIEDFGVYKGNYIYIGIKALSIATAIIAFYVDKNFERRGVILFGQVCTVILLFTIGVLSQSVFQHTEFRTVAVLVVMILYNVTWGLTLMTVTWVYVAQILQPRIIPFTSFAHWLEAAVVSYVFPVGSSWMDRSEMYILFGCWNLGLTVFSFFFLVESKNKSEVKIAEDFERKRSELCM